MKRLKYIVGFIAIIISAHLFTACASKYVVAAPPAPVNEVIITAPSPQYVWVPGYYSYNGSAYVFNSGSYQIPPSGKKVYTQGYWQSTPKGYRWVRSSWN